MKRRRKKINFHEWRYPNLLNSNVGLVSPDRLEALYREWLKFANRFERDVGEWYKDFCDGKFRKWSDNSDSRGSKKYEFMGFRRWYDKNRAALRSSVFQSYKAYRDAERAALHNRFFNLDPIKFDYEISLDYAGRWLTILEESYSDRMATYRLMEAFLLDVAIVEFVFLEETASDRESQVYHDWFLENEAFEARDIRLRGFSNKAKKAERLEALESFMRLYNYGGDRERSASIVSEVRARVSSEDPDEEVVDLIAAERGRFLSSNMDFESTRSSIISSVFRVDSFSPRLPELLAKIEEYLPEWNLNGRSAWWDVQTVEIKKSKAEFLKNIRGSTEEGEDS